MSDFEEPWAEYEPPNTCPHGYVEGEHHWFGCVGKDPFEDKPIAKIDPSLDISDRRYPRE